MRVWLLIVASLILTTGACRRLHAASGASATKAPPSARAKHPVRITKHAGLGAGLDVGAGLAASFDLLDVQVGRAQTKHQIRNCLDIFRLAPQTIYTVDPANQRPFIRMEAHCWALERLRDLRPSDRTFLGDLRLDEKAPNMLPADFYLVLSGDQERLVKSAARAGRSWKSFDPKVRARLDDRGELQVDGDGYDAIVTEYARGDFNGDGIEDILIRRDAFPTGGSLENYAVFILTRTTATSRLKVLKTWCNAY